MGFLCNVYFEHFTLKVSKECTLPHYDTENCGIKGYNYTVLTSYWYLNMRYTIIGCSRKRSFSFLQRLESAKINLKNLIELGIVSDKSNKVYNTHKYRDIMEKTIIIWLDKGIIDLK